MSPLLLLGLASALFVGSHFAMSHPLRPAMAAALGPRGFLVTFSLVSLATFGAMLWAALRVGPEAALWSPGEALWIAASLLMWAGSLLFIGSLRGNPALPSLTGAAPTIGQPRGVFAITRHPMMWGFAAWGLVHALVAPAPSVLIISAAILLLALVGSAGQDAKKERLLGAPWRQWEANTSFWPMGRGLALPDGFALIGGTAFFLAATWAHGALGAIPAGPWRYL